MMLDKICIGNAYFTTCAFDKVLDLMRVKIKQKQEKLYTAITNIHVMVLMNKDPEVAQIINSADVCFCDSISIVKLGKIDGKFIPRCYGPDYLIKSCEYGTLHGWRHFFLGGAEGIANQMAKELQQKFPTISIVGTFCPPFREMTAYEIEEMIEIINSSKPDIVWVGLGAGKQDKWINMYKNRIESTWFCGVGAAFDFISGSTKRAPILWQKLGLEWLYRFIFEPRRLLVRNLEGVALLIRLYLRSMTGKWIESDSR